jgi:hypothetical protein
MVRIAFEDVVRGSSFELRPLLQRYPSRSDYLEQRLGWETRLSCGGTRESFGQGQSLVVEWPDEKEADRRPFAECPRGRTSWSPYTTGPRYRLTTNLTTRNYNLRHVNILWGLINIFRWNVRIAFGWMCVSAEGLSAGPWAILQRGTRGVHVGVNPV